MTKVHKPGIEIEQIAWAANALKTRDLPKTVYKGLWLILDLLATTTGTPALTREEMAKTITSLQLVLDGQYTQINIPFWFLHFLNWYEYAKETLYSFDLAAAGAGKAMQMGFYLPFSLLRAASPGDTILDARRSKVGTAVLQCQFGVAAISTTVTITSGNLEIYRDEYTGVSDAANFARHEFSQKQKALNATGSITLDLDVGGSNQLRRVWIFTRDNAGALSDVQIDNVKVRSSNFTWIDKSGLAVKVENNFAFNLAPQTGVYVIDFPSDGRMSERIDCRSLDELVLDVNSLVTNGTMDVIEEKVIYPVNALVLG